MTASGGHTSLDLPPPRFCRLFFAEDFGPVASKETKTFEYELILPRYSFDLLTAFSESCVRLRRRWMAGGAASFSHHTRAPPLPSLSPRFQTHLMHTRGSGLALTDGGDASDRRGDGQVQAWHQEKGWCEGE